MAAPKMYDGAPHYLAEEKDVEACSPPSTSRDVAVGQHENSHLSFWTRMGCTPESFKQRTLADKHNQLNQTLKPRHLHMIAIGGSIGAGLFVGSGGALGTGGPVALLIAFGAIGIMMFNVVYALGELAILFPISGGFYTYSVRFIDPSWGFAMGWNYVFQWAIVLPLELTVAGLVVDYWGVGVRVSVWITVFLVAIILINVFGVLGYGEEEFWSSVLKLATIIIFVIVGIILVCGGGPSDGIYNTYQGGRLWQSPGAFANGFKGVCAVFVTAAFSFSGTELVGLAAAEAENPRKALPGAIKQVFWRITLFYIVSLTMIGLLVPYDEPRLIGSGLIDVSASPFVIVAFNAGLVGFDSFINVVILFSVLSIGNSCVYGGSRTLTALAEQGYAPRIFAYVDKAGRPLVSTVTILAFGLIAYIGEASNGATVFAWLLALSGLAALFTWGSICLAHIRFRSAWKYHGHTVSELPFQSMFGVWGSWLGLIIIFLVLVAQFWVALFPVGGSPPSAEAFFQSYLALPVVLLFWAAGYFWKREGWKRTSQMDVDSGRRQLDPVWEEELKMEKANAKGVKRFWNFLC